MYIDYLDEKSLDINLPSLSTEEKRVEAKMKGKLAWEGSIFGGVNTTKIDFSSANSDFNLDYKNGTERAFIGYNTGMSISALYKKLEFKMGLERRFMQTEVLLKTEEEVVVEHSQILARVYIDPANQQVVGEAYEDITTTNEKTRETLHYDDYTVVSVPLQIGLSQSFGKWSLGASSGASFDFLVGQNGKTLNTENQIIEFTSADTPVLFEKFGLSWRADCFVAYQLGKRCKLAFSPQYIRSKSLTFNGIQEARVQQIGANLGLKVKF
jgi:hypothetical protein